jgi:hypothetical protein
VNDVPIIDFDPTLPPARVLPEIERWVASDALGELVDAFNGPAPASGQPLGDRLADLAAFSEAWDFRGGAERNLAATREFAESHVTLILDAAAAVGLVHSRPPRFDRYDHVVVLGGLIRACILRPRLAAELVRSGLTVGTVTGIGAFRPLGGDEPELAIAAGLAGVANEFDAMDAGMRQAFSLNGVQSERGEDVAGNGNLSWRVREYAAENGGAVTVVAAPTGDPGRRANTPDSYRYFAEELVHLRPGDRVLAVTSAIYIPFQHADAIRMLGLPYGAIVDTVGVDTTTAREPQLRQQFTPANYLQEVRSTILAMRRLHEAVAAAS